MTARSSKAQVIPGSTDSGSWLHVDPTAPFHTTFDPNEGPASPWQVEHHPDWFVYWSNEKKLAERLRMGYKFVPADSVVSHASELQTHEVRIANSAWVRNGEGRIRNGDGQYLIAIPIRGREYYDRLKREKARSFGASAVMPTEQELAHLPKKARETVESQSFFAPDTSN